MSSALASVMPSILRVMNCAPASGVACLAKPPKPEDGSAIMARLGREGHRLCDNPETPSEMPPGASLAFPGFLLAGLNLPAAPPSGADCILEKPFDGDIPLEGACSRLAAVQRFDSLFSPGEAGKSCFASNCDAGFGVASFGSSGVFGTSSASFAFGFSPAFAKAASFGFVAPSLSSAPNHGVLVSGTFADPTFRMRLPLSSQVTSPSGFTMTNLYSTVSSAGTSGGMLTVTDHRG
mmetsp:Transcript_34289/g.101874  ORF Transcript_34289/g.101874 Transcript_34289/m.101874 type:complete len:236 (+) Transcript_34289:1824-2531(+)